MTDIITQHLDVWTSAQIKKSTVGRGSNGKQTAYGIKKLRELILELAVRGKLVPQEPNDEPASVLLEKIAEEKARLIKEGKIKQQKPLPEITNEEKPFDLPSGWQWARLGNIGNIFNGNSISASVKETKYTNINKGLPFIATKDVGYGREELNYTNGVSIPEDEPNFRVARKGAVLICAEGGSAGKKCGITNQNICFGNKLFATELHGDIESNYILANYLSPIFYEQFSKKVTGIIGGISTVNFCQLIVPFPPLAEQQRVVAKVGELMDLCDQLEQQQTDSYAAHQTLVETLLGTLFHSADQNEFVAAWRRIADHFDTLFTTAHSIEQLKQTILQLAVMGKLVPQEPNDEPASILLKKIAEEKARLIKEGKIKNEKLLSENGQAEMPFELPESWEWVKFDNIVDITSGITKGRKLTGRKVLSIPYLRVANVQRGFLALEEIKHIDILEEELEKFRIIERDLLITEGGDWDKVGRTAIWRGELPLVAHQNHVFKARLLLAEQNEIWLEMYLNSIIARDYFAGSSKQTTNLASINKTQLRGCLVAIPPIEEQHRIVAKVDELMALCDALKARINQAQTTQIHLADTIVEQAVA